MSGWFGESVYFLETEITTVKQQIFKFSLLILLFFVFVEIQEI